MKFRLARELAVKGTELVIFNRQILVPKPDVLIMVPLPHPGRDLADILIQLCGLLRDQLIELGCSADTRSEVPGTMDGVMFPPLMIPELTSIPVWIMESSSGVAGLLLRRYRSNSSVRSEVCTSFAMV